MTTATQIIDILNADQSWVDQFVLNLYPSKYGQPYKSTGWNLYSEVTVRLEVEGKTRRGKQKYQRRRLDAVAVIFPHNRQWRPHYVGFEVKVSKQDLLDDTKMSEYLPFCEFFYLAIPVELVEHAQTKLMQEGMEKVGILSLSEHGLYVEKSCMSLRPDAKRLTELKDALLVYPILRGNA